MGIDLAKALAYLHGNHPLRYSMATHPHSLCSDRQIPIVHCDVKSPNVLVSPSKKVSNLHIKLCMCVLVKTKSHDVEPRLVPLEARRLWHSAILGCAQNPRQICQ